jgi:hypothetical protein
LSILQLFIYYTSVKICGCGCHVGTTLNNNVNNKNLWGMERSSKDSNSVHN